MSSTRSLVHGAILMALVHVSSASIPERYQTIVDRNPFGLNPPSSANTEVTPPPPPVDIKLTGFADMSGETKAYFVIQPKDPKESVRYVNLSEGQSEGILELIKISATDGEVRIRNTGQDMTLSLKKDGLKPTGNPVAQQPQPQSVVSSTVYGGASGGAAASNPARVIPQPNSVVWNPGGQVAVQGRSQNAGSSFSPQPASGGFGVSLGNSSVVFSPEPVSSGSKSSDKPALDPAAQLASMHIFKKYADENGFVAPPPPPIPPALENAPRSGGKGRYVPPPPPGAPGGPR